MHKSKRDTIASKQLALKGVVFSCVMLMGTGIFLKSSIFCKEVSAHCATKDTSSASTQITPNYLTYSESTFKELLQAKKTIVLYFHAPWCNTCTDFDQELKSDSSQLPENVVVLQVPYDTSSELKQTYGVTYQHTLVLLDEKGETKEMWIGGDLKSRLNYL